MEHKIGDIIDMRSDGSCIYQSHRGILNLDNTEELMEEINEDISFISTTYEIFTINKN